MRLACALGGLGLRGAAGGLALTASPAQRLEQIGGVARLGDRLLVAADRRVQGGVRGATGCGAGFLDGPRRCDGRGLEGAAVEAGSLLPVLVVGDRAQTGQEGRSGRVLLGEPLRLGADRGQCALAGVEAPARLVLGVALLVAHRDDPVALLLLPARPRALARADADEPLADDGAEAVLAVDRRCLVRGVHGHRERGVDDELALGEHRALELADVVERHAGHAGDRLGRQAGADVTLDLARREAAIGAGLAHGAAGAGLHDLLERHAAALAVVIGDHDESVLDADDSQFTHGQAFPRTAVDRQDAMPHGRIRGIARARRKLLGGRAQAVCAPLGSGADCAR
ncbi:hypothetical protein GCM10025874_09140 [Arenivirga flava]|uniref:Uncharacterized protein n=1 Tax=Arenivirga flava TaxID=1930060 RepID=A0AA37XAT1_9MICO|nr:hypothetical protein [Arenivirga flava]GMA27661.1 hypothetical protein GCM10025874_09140 [Arenivirga flava]